MSKVPEQYHSALALFVQLLTSDMVKVHTELGYTHATPFAYAETGRKFDKILINQSGSVSVRYFVERSTGTIYGAKSKFAPNLKWYFGTVYTAVLWNWGDFHGHPVNDSSVRAVKSYGPYQHYMKV